MVERPVRSRGKTPVTTRTRSSQHNRDVSELSAGEGVLHPPREANTKEPLLLEVLKEPKPILAEKPSSKSTPLLHGLAHAQSTRTIHQVVLTARAESPSPRLTQLCCEEDGGLPLTLTTKAPSSELNTLLNTALLEDPAPSIHAPVGQSIRPLKQWPLGVPQEVRPLQVANSSPLPRLSGNDPLASFTVRPVSYVSHTPSSPSLKEQLESLSSLSAKFDMLSNRFTRDQRKSKNDLEPKWKQQKNTPFLSSVTPVRGQDRVSSSISKEPWVEKIAAGEQTPNRVDEKDILKEMFPYETNTPTGINATCRRPIRGAAGRPLKSGDLWTDETLLRSSHSSYTESRTATVHRVPTLPPSTRLLTSVAPPAGKAIAPPHGLPVWLKLLLLGIVAGFIFFIYQTMETNAMAPFGGSSDSMQTSGSEVRK
ncbi:uncharacterized protein LOC109896810 isoform X17 [Oncorhynchus kisutch]|nr:uncharacterized protein LOC109896810 isoform X17 [Oncorhynchus kisutch]